MPLLAWPNGSDTILGWTPARRARPAMPAMDHREMMFIQCVQASGQRGALGRFTLALRHVRGTSLRAALQHGPFRFLRAHIYLEDTSVFIEDPRRPAL